jgi:hypothetical protein
MKLNYINKNLKENIVDHYYVSVYVLGTLPASPSGGWIYPIYKD